MQIALIALGSRGDVQPFVALALGLRAAGHGVRVLAAHDFAALCAEHGVDFHPVGGRIDEQIDRERELVYDALDGALNPLHFGRRFLQAVGPIIPGLLADCLAGCRDADLILASTLGMFPGVSVAEKLGLPCYPAHMHPYSSTTNAPNVSFPELPAWAPLRGAYNLLTHALGEHGFWQLLREPLNVARRQILGLPALSPLALGARVSTRRGAALYAYSEAVLPRPADWGAEQQITGYWFLERPAGWRPPPELERFLAEGPPPVYIGFGSTLIGRDPARRSAMIVEALQRAGQRGLLYSTWGDLGNIALPESIMRIDGTPHDWLFPKVAAVVHHGGAGTTAAALRAGKPAVVVPVYGDQMLWAKRVRALGAGPEPLPRSQLALAPLAAAIASAANDPALRAGAEEVAARLRFEDGVTAALGALERLAQR